MRTIQWLIAGALSAGSVAAVAQEAPASITAPYAVRVTGARLAQLCAADPEGCVAYALGVLDSLHATHSAFARPAVCVPQTVNNARVGQAVVDHLQAHPEDGARSAAIVVIEALMNAFPCA